MGGGEDAMLWDTAKLKPFFQQLAIAFNTSLSPVDLEEEEELLYETAVFVIRSVTFVIAIVGIIGNTFVYLTATKMGEGGDSSGTMFMRSVQFQISSDFDSRRIIK